MTIVFYVEYPYYFPHFLPIAKAFEAKNHKVEYILSDEQNSELMEEIAVKNNVTYSFEEEKIFSKSIDYVFFANMFVHHDKIEAKTVFMDHGVGTKYCDFAGALEIFDMVLVEGDYRYDSLIASHSSDKYRIHKVGFSKLDMVKQFSEEEKEVYFKKYNIDASKPTILYAPTFFPSSIEKMPDTFPKDFKECNIIVKPHYMSLHRSRYKKQRKKFEKWSTYDNCSICDASEYSLIPFFNFCDVMISDESSAIFEYTSLDKPVILNRFLKLRWSYRLNPKKLFNRLEQAIDSYRTIGDNVQTYTQMVSMTKENLKDKNKYQDVRKKFAKIICGDVDGKTSERIVSVIENHYEG